MRGALVCAVAALLLVAGGAAGNGLRTVPVTTTPLDLESGEYDGVRLTGAWRLESSNRYFGGISGLVVQDQDVFAVTDLGWWIAARRGAEALGPEVAMQPMRDTEGGPFTKDEADAEGLTRHGGPLYVSFERDHRIEAHLGGDRIGETVQTPAMERLPFNGGMEALATLPDGRLIAIAEKSDAEGFPVFLVDAEGDVAQSRLPRLSRHDMTGADVGPDGLLYVVQRHFSFLTGLSVRVRRYHLGEDGLPDARTAETLAAWDSGSGIDNMEGISAFRDRPDGPVKLWLISDDNFSAVQRTVLVELEVE